VILEPALIRFEVIETAAQYDAKRKLPKMSLSLKTRLK